MRICLVTPAAPRTHHGNRVTAERWAGILGELGHQVELAQAYQGQPAGLLIALHARKSADSVRRFRADHPDAAVVLALTGTDLYPQLDPQDLPVLDQADRLVVLQPLGAAQVPAALRERVRVVYQSAPTPAPVAAGEDHFDVVVLAHLRPVKDPLLGAVAARLLPASSRIRIRHAGAVIDDRLGAHARAQSAAGSRYEWLGELPRPQAEALLASARLLLITSRDEGGANAVSEAVAAGVPVVATRIPGNVGLLGADYPGYFPVGDATAAAHLLTRAERDQGGLYADLRRRCDDLRPLVAPARETETWQRLLAELVRG